MSLTLSHEEDQIKVVNSIVCTLVNLMHYILMKVGVYKDIIYFMILSIGYVQWVTLTLFGMNFLVHLYT